MSLLSHFERPVDDAQHTFRRILKALSEPGLLVALPHNTGWQPLNPAATSVLLTLADQETPVYLDNELSSNSVQQNLRFHTGAPLVATCATASFAVFANSLEATQLATCPTGNELSPEHSVTVVIQTDNLHQGTALRLRGPGIEHYRTVAPRLPAAVLNYLLNRPVSFPAGIDFLFTCGENLMAIPRTTHVEVC